MELGQTLNTGRAQLAAAGTTAAGLVFGGTNSPFTSATETWDGSSWTTSSSVLASARRKLAGAGSSTAAFAAGGYNTQSATEEWNAGSSTVTFAS